MDSDLMAPIGVVEVRTPDVAGRIEAQKRTDPVDAVDVVRVIPTGLAEVLVFEVVAAALADQMVPRVLDGEDQAALMDRVEDIRC